MFDNHAGYTESRGKLARRKAKILAAKEVRVLPPMSREAWEAMPAAFRYFHSWEKASQPLKVVICRPDYDEAVRYFTREATS